MAIANPDFPLTLAAAMALETRLRASPVALARPVIILGGWRSPRMSATWTQGVLCPCTSNNAADFLSISYPWASTIEGAAGKALGRIRERYGDDERVFDIVGVSMGGLVARMLVHGVVRDSGPPIRAARIFTLASPHQGARFADMVAPDRAARALKRRSTMLERLDRELAGAPYELHCYALLHDWLVGATRAAPPGMQPRWLDTETLGSRLFSHYTINRDRRIIGDIALRLRGEGSIAGGGSPPPRD